MILVLFEVTIKKNHMDDYLALAANLKNELVKSEGFIRAERFSSLVNEGKLLSLSVWESEEAVSKWRNQIEHRMSQRQGHDAIFKSYTITVASQLRSYSNIERSDAPEDSNRQFL
ncbi:antibiotic biosynthesis monooxygenase family protein [Anaerosinus massiliensis]|uniref:antibiotic biosynthesis monooxygenase family protein n=1 Tax=Massilibacillus massiliensis TaxID=1806837 RepID=UPI000AAC1983|nr:antibiotic biosynthesis monooxygenase [Massilibacillus massiliensis]